MFTYQNAEPARAGINLTPTASKAIAASLMTQRRAAEIADHPDTLVYRGYLGRVYYATNGGLRKASNPTEKRRLGCGGRMHKITDLSTGEVSFCNSLWSPTEAPAHLVPFFTSKINCTLKAVSSREEHEVLNAAFAEKPIEEEQEEVLDTDLYCIECNGLGIAKDPAKPIMCGPRGAKGRIKMEGN
jgi:hypothetical protein